MEKLPSQNLEEVSYSKQLSSECIYSYVRNTC